jgi:hypothetical protein
LLSFGVRAVAVLATLAGCYGRRPVPGATCGAMQACPDELVCRASNDGLTSPASAGTITTMQTTDLLLFAVADGNPNTFGSPAPAVWTAADPLTGSPSTTQQVWFRNIGFPGTHDVSVTETSNFWDAALVGFARAN